MTAGRDIICEGYVQAAFGGCRACLVLTPLDGDSMFKIRQQQMDVLNQAMATDFESRTCQYLMKTYPVALKGTPAQEVQKAIRAGIKRAALYGMIAEYDVARFIDLMYRLSPDFDSNPETSWIRTVLDDPEIHPRVKMDLIHEKA